MLTPTPNAPPALEGPSAAYQCSEIMESGLDIHAGCTFKCHPPPHFRVRQGCACITKPRVSRWQLPGTPAECRLYGGRSTVLLTRTRSPQTIVRLRLVREGHTVESQAFVPGMGHGDLLVDGCLGIDVDGRAWPGEDRFAIDRDRDILAERLGRHVIRLRTSHIFLTWPHTLAVIERALSDALRESDRRRGRTLVRFDDPYWPGSPSRRNYKSQS
jgi:hypothetical protein